MWIKLPSGNYLNLERVNVVVSDKIGGVTCHFNGGLPVEAVGDNAKAILAAMEGMTTEGITINTPYHLLMSKGLMHEDVEAVRSSKNNLASVGDSIEDSYATNVPPADTGDGAPDDLPPPNDPPAAG